MQIFRRLTASALSLSLALFGVGCGVSTESVDEELAHEHEALEPGQRRCPPLTLRRLGLEAGPQSTISTTPVAGPMTAKIINHGRQITCSPPPTGNVEVGVTRWSDAYAPIRPRVTIRGHIMQLDPPLPLQQTSEGWRMLTGYTCNLGHLRLEGSGFPSRAVDIVPEFTWSWEPSTSTFRALCRVFGKAPFVLAQDRPKDVIATSGDRFLFTCDLAEAERRNACGALCSSQCTAFLTAPVDVSAVNHCTAECTDRCAAGNQCGPIFCSGSDCEAQACSAANRCSSNAACGSGRQCANGCCMTVIR